MFGFLTQTVGKLFGTDQAVKSVVDHAAGAIDKLWYSDQEKAEDKAKAAAEARAMVIDWMRATSGQNLARRLLAIMITGIWLLQYLFMMIMSTVSVWVEDPGAFVKSAEIMGGYAEDMKGAVMLILAFYFAAPHMGGIVQGALNKFAGK